MTGHRTSSAGVNRWSARIVRFVFGAVLLIGFLAFLCGPMADAAPLMPGDVLVGQDTVNTPGAVRQYHPDGALLDTLTTVVGRDGSGQQ